MLWRLFLSYAVVEFAVLIALASTIGLGWTLLILLATFVLGFILLAPLGGWQLARQLVQLRFGLEEPRSALSDGAIVTVATGLVLVPGLLTTALGLLLLVPPIRAAARPGLTAIAVRGFLRRVPLTPEAAASVADAFNLGDTRDDRDFIEGEVLDVTDVIDVEPPILPQGPIGGEPPPRPASSPG